MENKLTITPEWRAEGVDLPSFIKASEKLSSATEYLYLNTSRLAIVPVLMETGTEKNPEFIMTLLDEDTLDEFNLKGTLKRYIVKGDARWGARGFDVAAVREILNGKVGFMLRVGGENFLVNRRSLTNLARIAKLGGKGNERKTLVRFAELMEGLAAEGAKDRDVNNICLTCRKVGIVPPRREVACVNSGSYVPRPQTIAARTAEYVLTNAKRNPKLRRWVVDYNTTYAEIAYKARKNEGFAPGTTIMTSETGECAFTVGSAVMFNRARIPVIVSARANKDRDADRGEGGEFHNQVVGMINETLEDLPEFMEKLRRMKNARSAVPDPGKIAACIPVSRNTQGEIAKVLSNHTGTLYGAYVKTVLAASSDEGGSPAKDWAAGAALGKIPDMLLAECARREAV